MAAALTAAVWTSAADAAPAEPTAPVALSNAGVEAMAARAPRGAFPRAFSGEQSYWTLVGVDGGADSGLISEDGAIELGKGGASIEPFVIDAGRLVTWADVRVSQTLMDGSLPIPSVEWRGPGWQLRVTALAAGDPRSPRLAARYQLRNLTARPRRLVLALAIRPFQVDGPLQFLNMAGGVSPIHDLTWDGARLTLNGRRRVYALTPPGRFAAGPLSLAALAKALVASPGAASLAVHEPSGMTSGTLAYTVILPAHGRAVVDWVSPLGDPGTPFRAGDFRFGPQRAAVAEAWRRRLGHVVLITPPAGRAISDTLRTSLAYMLISRKGSMLRPGTRSYDRSWIRDGAMISEALLRLGETGVAADYLRWYAPYQLADGAAPCCIDARGADPTPENDSDGEFIFLAAEVYRYGGDKALLQSMWPRIQAAIRHMDALRARSDPAARPETHGLLPPSISHEGYASKPAYSYWDDFWGLRGYDDAAFIARVLGDRAASARLSQEGDAFGRDIRASLRASALAHGVDYVPGAADLGDFDATSTTIALAPLGEAETPPEDLLHNTFERYWRAFLVRSGGDQTWDAYTPYELRSVGAFVRLGRRDRADALLDAFLKDRRPLAWNGWAEVVGREARKPRFIGDMPHAWVASDYVRSVLDMFAFDRASDRSLVLGAGVPPAWFDAGGVGIANLRTPYGPLTWSARRRRGRLIVRIGGRATPPGGFVFPWPFAGPPGRARFNGAAVAWESGAVRLNGQGELVIETPSARR